MGRRVCACASLSLSPCVYVGYQEDRPHLLLSYRKIKWLGVPAADSSWLGGVRRRRRKKIFIQTFIQRTKRDGKKRESDLALIQVSPVLSHISAGAAILPGQSVGGFIHSFSGRDRNCHTLSNGLGNDAVGLVAHYLMLLYSTTATNILKGQINK